MFSNSCECGHVNTEQIACFTETKVKEQHCNILICHLNKSAAAEHGITLGHFVLFQRTSILLSKKSRHTDRTMREATKTELHSNSMKTHNDRYLCLSSDP
jgi:hypothetical protein